MADAAPATIVELPGRRSPAVAAFVALRPRQWTKNLLLFAGIIFAAELGDAGRWAAAITAFVAYCAASSASYLVNDVRDVASDRLHPVKRARPVARGELGRQRALVLAAALTALALALAAVLGPLSLACMAGFLALQAAYSLRLKTIELVDVIAIAGLFVLRASAGAVAVDVRISEWLLLCTFLLALFLALGKRRAELALERHPHAPGARGLRAGARRPAARDRGGGDDRRVLGVRPHRARVGMARRDGARSSSTGSSGTCCCCTAAGSARSPTRSSSRTCRCS